MTARTIKKLSDDSVISTETYSYDAAGNMTAAPDSTFSYDTNNRLTWYNGDAVSYDADGNMVTAVLQCDCPTYFEYDSANRLLSACGHTYTYNAEDVRIRNLCSGEDAKYTYNTNCKLSKLLWKETNGTVTKYVYGRGLIGEETGSSFTTYHFDCRGSTVALTDSTGNITDTFAYDTYGGLISRTGTSAVIFLYNGRDGVVTDTNGLIYMRARYYSPDMRRFINADIIHGSISDSTSLNRFAYANGNPVSNIDPFGLAATIKDGDDGTTKNSSLRNGCYSSAINIAGTLLVNPWNELYHPGQIHNAVVRYLHYRYGFEKEHVSAVNPAHRYDLFSPGANAYWEVKPISYFSSETLQASMEEQMTGYDKDGVIRGWPLGYHEMDYLQYDVKIYSVEPGKVYYVFMRERQKDESTVSVPLPEVQPSPNEKKDTEELVEGVKALGTALVVTGVVALFVLGAIEFFSTGSTVSWQQATQQIAQMAS